MDFAPRAETPFRHALRRGTLFPTEGVSAGRTHRLPPAEHPARAKRSFARQCVPKQSFGTRRNPLECGGRASPRAATPLLEVLRAGGATCPPADNPKAVSPRKLAGKRLAFALPPPSKGLLLHAESRAAPTCKTGRALRRGPFANQAAMRLKRPCHPRNSPPPA